MPGTTLLEMPYAEQAQMLAALRRALWNPQTVLLPERSQHSDTRPYIPCRLGSKTLSVHRLGCWHRCRRPIAP
jgi:hypothetical protein